MIVRESWNERLGADLPIRLRNQIERWSDEYPERANEHPLGVEVFWERGLPRPEADRKWEGVDPDELPAMNLIGFIDEVYWDSVRDLVVVRDNKSGKTLGAQTAVDDMMDSQLMLYAWGAAPLVASWEYGAIRAVAYDRVRSVQPKPPTVTTAGKLATRLGEPTIGMCDLATYREWAKGPDGQGVPYLGRKPVNGEAAIAGYYQAEESVLEKLARPDQHSAWFQRTRVPLSIFTVRAHLRAAVDSATDIWRTQKRVEVMSEAARNLSLDNCRWCDYAQICRAQMIGGPEGEYELADYNLKGRDGVLRLGQ
jgi:hypothetical protein